MHLPPELIQGIRNDPENLNARLVAADWLEEHGQPERAEYIRLACRLGERNPELPIEASWTSTKSTPLQDLLRLRECHRRDELLQANESTWLDGSPLLWAGWQANSTWVPSFEWEWRRGFVEDVRCSLVDWYGGDCGRCKGRGKGVFGKGGAGSQTCPDCEGHGKVGGHGPEILRSQPVLTVRTEKRPHGPNEMGRFAWTKAAVALDYWKLPVELLDDMVGGFTVSGHDNRFWFSREEAEESLSSALIRWALGRLCNFA